MARGAVACDTVRSHARGGACRGAPGRFAPPRYPLRTGTMASPPRAARPP